MHTTASDGRLTPSALVARAAAVGLSTISVTDHDTVAALAEVRAYTTATGMALVPGIEVTSIHNGRDVHILGYFIDDTDQELARFLAAQRGHRVARVHEIGAKLSALGVPIDVERLLRDTAANPGSAVGRPAIARAMMDAGYIASFEEAFNQYLGTGQPAFVPRAGPSPSDVVAAIHAAGGVASLAHPGITNQPALIEPLAANGLDALEAYHTDHTPYMRDEALAIARRLGLLVSGGSDYHGDDARRPIGKVTLPRADFDALAARAKR
jgi:3',5'-nucleoside bisphosphate phosphatase